MLTNGHVSRFGKFDRGSNQSGMRAYNERLLLSLLRRHGAMAKSEIAQLTGLSAQTVSVIMRKLEKDGLLRRGEPTRVRGKVGQPSVPISLKPDGAYFFGLKLDRRSSDLILIDFVGREIGSVHQGYPYPTPEITLEFTLEAIAELTESLPVLHRERISGLGICIPSLSGEWVESIGAPPAVKDAWKTCDLRARIEPHCSYPVFLQSEATAACGAELVLGQNAEPLDIVYFYIGYSVGGGVVINGSLFEGKNGNAGALGSMPVFGADGTSRQLVEVASIAVLERSMLEAGADPASLWDSALEWEVDADMLESWIDSASAGIAQAILSATAVIDFETALIDGWLPAGVRRAIVEGTRDHLLRLNSRGVELPSVCAGSVGPEARELGAASLPLSSRFLLDLNALLDRG